MEKTKLYTVRMVPKMTQRNSSAPIPDNADLITGSVYMADMFYDKKPMRYVGRSKSKDMPVFECKYLGSYRSDLFGATVIDSRGNQYKIIEMSETMPWEMDGVKSELISPYGEIDTKVLVYRLRKNAAPMLLLLLIAWAIMYAITGAIWVLLPLALVAAISAAFMPEDTLKLKDK